jgi:hypothetical protein
LWGWFFSSKYLVPHGSHVVVSLVHTSLGSSYLIANVLHYPPPLAHSFVLGTAVINVPPMPLGMKKSEKLPKRGKELGKNNPFIASMWLRSGRCGNMNPGGKITPSLPNCLAQPETPGGACAQATP